MTLLTGRADLHMHTTASDGTATAAQLLDYVALHRPDLDVIAITDHDVIDASLWAADQNGRYPFEIVPGTEVTSRDGHVLAWWVHDTIPAGLSLSETAAAIHEQGGVAVLAHPFELLIAPHTFLRYLRHPDVLMTAGIDAVETFNAGAFTPGGSWLAGLRFSHGDLPIVGNSDAHMPQQVGSGVTHFRGHTAADFRRALEAGETAAEGKKWDISVYYSIYRATRRATSSAGSARPSLETVSPAASSTVLPQA